MQLEESDKPPAGWFLLDVVKKTRSRKWDWFALMVDVDPNDLKYYTCDVPALFYVHPDEHRPGEHGPARQCCVSIPGKHRNREAAWDAVHQLIEGSLH
jgi:hypothetical protein